MASTGPDSKQGMDLFACSCRFSAVTYTTLETTAVAEGAAAIEKVGQASANAANSKASAAAAGKKGKPAPAFKVRQDQTTPGAAVG